MTPQPIPGLTFSCRPRGDVGLDAFSLPALPSYHHNLPLDLPATGTQSSRSWRLCCCLPGRGRLAHCDLLTSPHCSLQPQPPSSHGSQSEERKHDSDASLLFTLPKASSCLWGRKLKSSHWPSDAPQTQHSVPLTTSPPAFLDAATSLCVFRLCSLHRGPSCLEHLAVYLRSSSLHLLTSCLPLSILLPAVPFFRSTINLLTGCSSSLLCLVSSPNKNANSTRQRLACVSFSLDPSCRGMPHVVGIRSVFVECVSKERKEGTNEWTHEMCCRQKKVRKDNTTLRERKKGDLNCDVFPSLRGRQF